MMHSLTPRVSGGFSGDSEDGDLFQLQATLATPDICEEYSDIKLYLTLIRQSPGQPIISNPGTDAAAVKPFPPVAMLKSKLNKTPGAHRYIGVERKSKGRTREKGTGMRERKGKENLRSTSKRTPTRKNPIPGTRCRASSYLVCGSHQAPCCSSRRSNPVSHLREHGTAFGRSAS